VHEEAFFAAQAGNSMSRVQPVVSLLNNRKAFLAYFPKTKSIVELHLLNSCRILLIFISFFVVKRNLNAIFFLLRFGCQWRMLLRDFPAGKVVYFYYGE